VATRLRRALGLEELTARLDALEQHAAGVRYPHGPLYIGDHQALVATRWGAKLVVDTRDSLLAPWLLLDGLWEAHVTGWMQQTLKPGDMFVDVGANIGYFTLLAAQAVGDTGRVVAVEAHPGLAELLRRNTVINGVHPRVQVFPHAAWSEATKLRFHQRAHYSANSSVGSMGEAALSEFDDHEDVVEVEAVRLDDLLAGVARVDLVKVDVEGAEVRAFTGMEQTLSANPDVTIMFEWSPAQLRLVGDQPADLVDILAGQGFGFRLLESDLAPIDRDGLLALPYGNVVARRP
jgi:FkbM family methyltransferase